jgi:hypothetical protein
MIHGDIPTMTGNQVLLTDSEYQLLHSMSQSTGRPENELLHEALDLLKAQVDLESRRALLRSARGMWRDRDDLPSLTDLRNEMNRDFPAPAE